MAPRTAKGQNTRPPPRSNPEDSVHAAQQPVYVAQDPCNPSPCGPNAQCRDGICTCVPEYRGDPYLGCRPECVLSTDCPRDKACIRQKCADPCPGTCGQNARCEVVNHIPICSCPPGYSGNAFVDCRIYQEPVLTQPCQPSPCGPNSQCREVNNQAVCSCVAGYVGSPPTCRPECVVNSDCSQNEACSNQKCRNPCPGTCGVGARCEVINHNHICSCPARYTGDPFVRCSPIPDTPPPPPVNPCQPSPCGPYAECRVVGDSPSCSCLPEYKGSPPNCRPEYVSNSECPSHLACINQKCRDPCPGSCGANAECRVVSHTPNCVCLPGYQGDPFSQCYVQQEPIVEEKAMPCNPSPCGANAVCREQNGAGSCTCLPEYIGNPYEGGRPECILNSDCASNKACISGKCQDPCPGTCGQNADCQVVNHLPSCTCRPGYVGDPFRYCNLAPRVEVPVIVDPCNPSPCGPNAQCRKVNEQAVCSCLPNYVRSPPGCRPECVVSSECPLNRACVNQKCVDPCPGTCGQNAICKVVNHVPICACPEGQTGDPFYRCQHIPAPIPVVSEERVNPCYPSPCGPHYQCRNIGGAPSCSCLQGYYGTPPSCRPECTINPECRSNLACIREKCRDPCPGSCGVGAQCSVINHVPICTCQQGYTGDPFISCHVIPQEPVVTQPCNPSPCGPNSQCRVLNNVTLCSCLPEYVGSPPSCRLECVLNSECNLNQACSNQKCQDPCSGTCGTGALCEVVNHNPICSCPSHMTGYPFVRCYPPAPVEAPPINPCQPSPCGPYAECRVIGDSPSCSCLPEYRGSPPNCRPECVSNSECPSHQACINQKCKDPCPETCGAGAECRVISHTPNCFCPAGFFGDPFVHCRPQPGLREAACT